MTTLVSSTNNRVLSDALRRCLDPAGRAAGACFAIGVGVVCGLPVGSGDFRTAGVSGGFGFTGAGWCLAFLLTLLASNALSFLTLSAGRDGALGKGIEKFR